jgi:phage gp36-like protein
MTYTSTQQLIDRFGEHELIQLTDRGGFGAINKQVAAQAISDANAEVDAYLRVRYPLPLLTVPEELIRVASDLARYQLYDNQMVELVQDRRDQSINFLHGLSKGTVALPLSCISTESGGANIATPSSRVTVYTDAQLGLMP